MTSRHILAISLIALAALVFLGGMALHFSASPAAAVTDLERVSEAVGPHENPRPSPTYPTDRLAEASGPLSAAASRRSFAADTPLSGAAARRGVASDTLRALLTRVHLMFDARSSEIKDRMIPYLAQIITLVNQHDDVVYLLEILEPDAELARQRAQVLNEVLRLNVLNPAGLRISGHEGSHGVHVNVSS